MEQCSNPPAHVLIFPVPGQGHVNAMLKLAELLALAGLKITFLSYELIHENLVRSTDIEARFAKYHEKFQFKTIPNCWSPEDFLVGTSVSKLRVFMDAMKSKSKPIFKIDCIIMPIEE